MHADSAASVASMRQIVWNKERSNAFLHLIGGRSGEETEETRRSDLREFTLSGGFFTERAHLMTGKRSMVFWVFLDVAEGSVPVGFCRNLFCSKVRTQSDYGKVWTSVLPVLLNGSTPVVIGQPVMEESDGYVICFASEP